MGTVSPVELHLLKWVVKIGRHCVGQDGSKILTRGAYRLF